jgi:hypothetical protein
VYTGLKQGAVLCRRVLTTGRVTMCFAVSHFPLVSLHVSTLSMWNHTGTCVQQYRML